MAKQRESNIELFRVVATVMILLLHHNGWFLSLYGGITDWHANGPCFAIGRTLIQSICYVAVDCFILISGYFSIRLNWRSILNLASQLLFFYLIAYAIRLGFTEETFSVKKLATCFMVFSRDNWFIRSYFFLLLLSPVLNAFVDNTNEYRLRTYTLLFAGLVFYYGCILGSNCLAYNRGYSITSLLLLYLVGRYYRLYGESQIKDVPGWKIGLLYLICLFLMMAGFLFIPSYWSLWSYGSPIQIVMSVALFTLFCRIHIQSKWINWLGVSSFAAYIFHTQSPIVEWLARNDFHWFNTFSFGHWLICIISSSVAIFIVSVLLDKIRIMLFKPLIDYVVPKS